MKPSHQALRVLIGKPGLDGHDRGAKVVARALQDAGIEVTYSGLHRTPAQIVDLAHEVHADAVGLSILSGAHMTLVPAVLDLMSERGMGDVPVFLGGIIPRADVEELLRRGVRTIFDPGAPVSTVVSWVADNVRTRAEAH